MGAVSFSLAPSLMQALAETGRFSNFVETGTFHGETALAASQLFTNVWTVEASPELH